MIIPTITAGMLSRRPRTRAVCVAQTVEAKRITRSGIGISTTKIDKATSINHGIANAHAAMTQPTDVDKQPVVISAAFRRRRRPCDRRDLA